DIINKTGNSNNLTAVHVNFDVNFLKYRGSTQHIDLWQISQTDFLFSLNESMATSSSTTTNKIDNNNEFHVIFYYHHHHHNHNQKIMKKKQVVTVDENLFLFHVNHEDYNDMLLSSNDGNDDDERRQKQQLRVLAKIVDGKGNIMKEFNLLLTRNDGVIYLDDNDGDDYYKENMIE